VSAFWRYEVLNALLVGERRKRITLALTQAFLDDLDRLPVDVDVSPSSATVFTATQSLCRARGLQLADEGLDAPRNRLSTRAPQDSFLILNNGQFAELT
jgi:hypothetical protein